ncbi:NodT family efflux transporter outer membrane factor (OMF) lipoprotein [Pelomonas saccharophila]|uniref:NodT family efflux transporter outer membrane factor (OMF) lipoprotein n=1 Tax=Roseateles saccharophilus TaxID=304 RepID=A0ABU1YSA1_ROSSA|nr:efflux transporter outer membrane subunit [Roseateles saccharophilus]MDR7271735.1 NodT family efflux transporter outer membrane factor (OMF) lipoprotein [Roseateles saccharophilus]
MNHPRKLLVASLLALLSACMTAPPAAAPASTAIPAAWRSPLPHGGSTAALNDWWKAFDDPLLARLIERAQGRSPTLAQAAARRRQAEASATQARAALLPQATANAQAQRGRNLNTVPGMSTQGSAQFNASWEVDLFGGLRAAAAAEKLQAQAATSDWHAARVSLAADVAQAYVQLRLAQAHEESSELDNRFAEQIAAWGREQQKAGLISVSDAALLNTDRAVASATRSQWRAEAQIALQSLALLCGEQAQDLAKELAPPAINDTGFELRRSQPKVPGFDVGAPPAQLLAQRPDVAAAHQRWLAALQQQRSVEAQRWPQLSLGALAGESRLRVGGSSSNTSMWAIGPSLSLPLFDGGQRKARAEGAEAAADEAAAALQARWQTAVAEVEESLQRVAAGAEREREVDAVKREWEGIALRSFSQAQAGLQSGVQRNTTFRNALAAYDAVLSVRAEHALAWIRLYRSLGGGWTAEAPTNTNTASAR